MFILGISAYYHDSAACLIRDGEIVSAAEEERFSRIKHDNGFPYKAIEFCLKYANISINDIDYVSYYEKPLLKFERIMESFVQTYPFSLLPFLKGIPEWLGYKIKIEQTIRKKLKYKRKIFFIPHHYSHASVAFYPSGFNKAAICTIDGVGEYQTTGLWIGEKNSIIPLRLLNFPNSLGLLYSTFTAFLGFKVNEDEYKVMGLSAYGSPSYVKQIYQLIDVKPDGSFKMNMDYFSFRESFQMWSKKFEGLFGKPRLPNNPIRKRDKDLAASIQKVTEEIYIKILNHLYKLAGSDNLCLSGGVALNALANGKIYARTSFKKVYLFGAAGDSGAAVGTALYVYNSLLYPSAFKLQGFIPNGALIFENDSDRKENLNSHLKASVGIYQKVAKSKQSGIPSGNDRTQMVNLYLGSQYSNEQIEQALAEYKLKYRKFRSEDELISQTAKLLSQGKIIGWFQGRMEFGPRALGARSILAKPNPRQMKDRVNKIKRREQFRPFAGSVLQEKAGEYFAVPEKNHPSPFMTFCFPVKTEKQKELAAIVHADGTCRIQTVAALTSFRAESRLAGRSRGISKDNDRYYRLIKEFYKLTGTACILNTSFNIKGEPIVENPRQAIEDFLRIYPEQFDSAHCKLGRRIYPEQFDSAHCKLGRRIYPERSRRTKMDCLVIGDYLVMKSPISQTS